MTSGEKFTGRLPEEFSSVFIVVRLAALTLDAGFIIAESADIGLLIGCCGVAISIMTTWLESPIFSRTQIYLSDSIVRVLNPIVAALMPTDVSCKLGDDMRQCGGTHVSLLFLLFCSKRNEFVVKR